MNHLRPIFHPYNPYKIDAKWVKADVTFQRKDWHNFGFVIEKYTDSVVEPFIIQSCDFS